MKNNKQNAIQLLCTHRVRMAHMQWIAVHVTKILADCTIRSLHCIIIIIIWIKLKRQTHTEYAVEAETGIVNLCDIILKGRMLYTK